MIVAIGGGDQRREETRRIDQAVLRLTGQPAPRLLFLPTAVKDNPRYSEGVKPYFEAMGCEVRLLELTKNPSPRAVDEALSWSHIIYVGGGDTNYLVKNLNRHFMREKFAAALERGVVLAGISAGAICWFDGGMAAYNGYKPLPGLGLVRGKLVPHYGASDSALEAWFGEHPDDTVFGVEDRAAVTWDGQYYGVLSDAPEAAVWKLTAQGRHAAREGQSSNALG